MSRVRVRGLVIALMSLLCLGGAGAAWAGSAHGRHVGMSAKRIAAIAGRQGRARVIVLLRNEHRGLPATRAHVRARTRALAADQRPLQTAVRASGGAVHQSFHTVNAFAATVSHAERARLDRNPAVAAVVPDTVVTDPVPNEAGLAYTATPETPGAHARPNDTVSPAPDGQRVCPADPAKPLIAPEGLSLIHDQQARALGFDGSGVKVAFFGEGIDTSNPDFIRPDGSKVIVDYRDFTGEGPNAPSPAGEAFGDASTIAAQGRVTYDLSTFVNPANSLPKGCNIRLQGVAPGASLVAMKVFGGAANSFTSTIIQAMDWAVSQDHVNILNESFGADPLPDSDQDLTKQFNDQAVAAGVTVTASSGDQGTANTIGSPASDPNVLDVAATTQFQGIAQTVRGGYQLANKGWANDNIAEFSSSGFTQDGGTVDLAAPGNESFEACTPSKTYEECHQLGTQTPTNISTFGGTSESAPMTAGVAALMIQAYRHTHGGASPSAALVKQIITSNADDLDIPSQEQGAGELNAYTDVQAAESADGGTPTGSSRLVSPSQLDLAQPAGSQAGATIQLTNNGSTTKTYSSTLRTLGAPLSDVKADINMTPKTDPTFIDHLGVTEAYQKTTFTVPAGAQRIDAALAHPGNSAVNMVLLDPNGRYTAYTYHPSPEDDSSYSHIDVRNPQAGQWTAIFFTPKGCTADKPPVCGYSGPVHYEFSTSRFTSAGSVSPSSVTLAPGQSTSLKVATTAPATPGDYSRDVQISDGSATSVVPVVMRSLVALSGGQGHLSGTITGGNGNGLVGREDTFAFDIPSGTPQLQLRFALNGDPNTQLIGFLVSPEGQAIGQQAVGDTSGDETLTLYAHKPIPGRWRFVLLTENPVGGTAVTGPFHANLSLAPTPISAKGVPQGDSTIASGHTAKAVVSVTNPGNTPLNVIIDPRRDTRTWYSLTAVDPTVVSLPLSGDELPPEFGVPTETDGLRAVAHGSAPILFDWGFGNPDLGSYSRGNDAFSSFNASSVTPGLWFLAPALRGPFAGPVSGTASTAMAADTRTFDGAVRSSTGDPLLEDVAAKTPPSSPIVVAPHTTKPIAVTFSAAGGAGTLRSGDLFVDDYQAGSVSADELGSVPYRYRVR